MLDVSDRTVAVTRFQLYLVIGLALPEGCSQWLAPDRHYWDRDKGQPPPDTTRFLAHQSSRRWYVSGMHLKAYRNLKIDLTNPRRIRNIFAWDWNGIDPLSTCFGVEGHVDHAPTVHSHRARFADMECRHRWMRGRETSCKGLNDASCRLRTAGGTR